MILVYRPEALEDAIHMDLLHRVSPVYAKVSLLTSQFYAEDAVEWTHAYSFAG